MRDVRWTVCWGVRNTEESWRYMFARAGPELLVELSHKTSGQNATEKAASEYMVRICRVPPPLDVSQCNRSAARVNDTDLEP